MTEQNTPDNDDNPETTAPETAEAPPEIRAEASKADDTDSAPAPDAPSGDRIAKVMARAGVASRREAERMILEGRVSVNGRKIDSPALDILPSDQVRIDGQPMDAPQETRLWLYYKPVGLVTSESDEKGRQTVFDALPRDLPRVMSVGRLDLNSEGLLLLTNDGELKRRLELPATAWLRRYRVRVNGNPTELTFDPLRRGATIDGEDFAPMEIKLDSQQGANAWLTVGIREGRNREIRRAMAHVGLQVNRLIRIGYGPFKLAGLEVNEVREVKRRILRDQLGGLYTGETEGEGDTPRRPRASGAARGMGLRPDRPPRRDAPEGERPERKPRMRKDADVRRPDSRSDGRGDKREGGFDRKPRFPREDGDRRPFARRDDAPRGERPQRDGERGPRPAREGGFERKPRFSREDGDRRSFGGRSDAARDERRRDERPRQDGERRSFAPRRGDEDRPARAGGGAGFGSRGGPRGDSAGTGTDRPDRKGGGFRPGGPRSAGPGRAGPGPAKPGSSGPRGAGPHGSGPRSGGPRGDGPGRGGPKGRGPKGGGPKGGPRG